jgi:signal transduction histidine kinase
MTADRTRILLVDDNQSNLVALQSVLAPLGQETVAASSGSEALRRLLRQEFAVVLLDVRMPDMDGLAVAELIRSRPSTSTLPVLFLTAYAEAEQYLRDAYSLGAADFIFKPVDPDTLRAKVGVFVELHRQQRRVSELLLQAEAASRAKSEFLRMAAHELRTPLGIINGYLSMLREGTFERPPASWSHPLGVLVRKTQELTTLVDDILEASRMEADVVAGVTRPVNLGDLARRALERVHVRFQDLEAELSVDLPVEPVWAQADPDHVSRILDGLLDNALSYSRIKPWARVQISRGEQAVVEVEDRGVGIPDDLREKIFERFFRIDDPELATRPGTGLGLYISRALAQCDGGWLELGYSTPGQGSRFVLTLPLAQAQGMDN